MSEQITVTLPDHLYKRVQRLAELLGHHLSPVINESLGMALPPLASELQDDPIETLSDEQILSLAESMMSELNSVRMSYLATKQKNVTLNESELAELQMLIELYDVGQLRKAHALAEAVKRGILSPLES